MIQNRPSGMDASKLAENIKMAIKQLVNCTDINQIPNVPKAGQNGYPENHGQGLDPGLMAAGPTHRGGRGAKFRSVTVRECEALYFKYPKGIEIEIIEDEDDERRGDIGTGWGVPGRFGGNALGAGPSEPAGNNEPDRTGSGNIHMKPGARWHLAEDTDGDGYITNKDSDQVPDNAYDFYSIFKHELGHVLCFNHSCVAPLFEDEFPSFLPTNFFQFLHNFFGEISGFHSNIGDNETSEPETIFFSALSEEGYGGYDIWAAEFFDGVYMIYNLGPAINTAFNEVEPFVTSDGSQLYFSSDRPGGFGGYDLYNSYIAFEEMEWLVPFNLGEVVNSSWDERSPTLRGDIMTLYFASNREGGLGGFDIWHSEIVPELSYTEPTNLYAVNSKYNEVTPFIAPAGACIYFSSDRPGGFGGYDIWRAANISGWRAPKCLPEIINTMDDELSPSLRNDHSSLMIYSNRPTSTGNNLFFYDVIEPNMPEVIESIGGTLVIPATTEKFNKLVNIKNMTSSTIAGYYIGVISTNDYTTFPHFSNIEDFQLPNMTRLGWTSFPSLDLVGNQSVLKLYATNEDISLHNVIAPMNNIIFNFYFSKSSVIKETDAIVISPFNKYGYQIMLDYPFGHHDMDMHSLFNGFALTEVDGVKGAYYGFNGTDLKVTSLRFIPENEDIKVVECLSSIPHTFDSDNGILYYHEYIEPGEHLDYCFKLNRLENLDFQNGKIFTNVSVKLDTAVNFVDNDNFNNNIIEIICSPNPAFSELKIDFKLTQADYVKLTINDLFGREIKIITDGYSLKNNSLSVNINELSAGVYIVKLTQKNNVAIKKVVIIK